MLLVMLPDRLRGHPVQLAGERALHPSARKYLMHIRTTEARQALPDARGAFSHRASRCVFNQSYGRLRLANTLLRRVRRTRPYRARRSQESITDLAHALEHRDIFICG
jgi:hypothetical protein